VIAPVKFLSYLDKIAASRRTAEAAARLAVLQGMVPILIGGDGSAGHTQYGAGDGTFITTLNGPTIAMLTAASPDKVESGVYSAWLSAVAAYIRTNASAMMVGPLPVTTLDLYASYQNSLTRDSFLLSYDLAYLQFLAGNSAPSLMLSPGNVFAPITTFGAATVGASAAITYTAGAAPNSIPTANAGAVQGYTPAPSIKALITTTIGGTLTITVTGTGRTAAGALVSGRTWTGVLDSAASGATITLTPTVAGDRIASVVSVAGAGAAGSGAFTLQSVLERIVS
jgi:hypothetical protein